MSKKIVVDEETGVIISELGTGDRIVRKSSMEYLNCNMEFKTTNFIKLNTKELQLTLKDLNQSEKMFLISIIPYVAYSTCILRYDNGKDITTEQLRKIVDLSRNKFFEVQKGLREKYIIFAQKTNRGNKYYVNPWIIYKGNRINKDLKTMFSDYKIKHLQKEWRDL